MKILSSPVSLSLWLLALGLSNSSRVAAFGIRPFAKSQGLDPLNGPEDLASSLHLQTAPQDETFSKAIQILRSIKSSPSCNRIAASRLLTSSQSIKGEGEDHGKAQSLDHVKSLYAARLAVCELTGAGAALPTDCVPVAPPPVGQRQRYRANNEDSLGLEEDDIPSGQLERCLRSLESRPQWWTSYSNSRQNAVVMCQATRIEIDREDLLALHKTLTEATSSLTDELKDILRNAAAESSKNKAFMQAVETMRVNLADDLEESSSFTRGLFSKLYQDVEAAFRHTLANVVTMTKGAESHVEALNQVKFFETHIKKQVLIVALGPQGHQ
jgi:hypothetical protein